MAERGSGGMDDILELLKRMHGGERAEYSLRALFERYGYVKYRMGRFEEYDFYTDHRDFLPSGRILTFTDLNGKLMALRPDVTMSIIKRTRALPESPERLYYSERIYRPAEGADEFRELAQVGLEFIGRVTDGVNAEIVGLALKSLAGIERESILDVSHNGFLIGLFEGVDAPDGVKRELARRIETKNRHELAELLKQHRIEKAQAARLLAFAGLCDSLMELDAGERLREARKIAANARMTAAIDELTTLFAAYPDEDALRLDFSLSLDGTYYNGLVLRGYIRSAARSVLSGGRYDPLLRRMGIGGLEAIGFAVYLDEIDAADGGHAERTRP